VILARAEGAAILAKGDERANRQDAGSVGRVRSGHAEAVRFRATPHMNLAFLKRIAHIYQHRSSAILA
jgi:hypothetical protein